MRQGHAVAYRKYSERYIAQEAAARETRAGMWGGEFTMPLQRAALNRALVDSDAEVHG